MSKGRQLRSTAFPNFKKLRRQMDKAFLSLKNKGVGVNDKIFKSKNETRSNEVVT
jgi:hypothetical protein